MPTKTDPPLVASDLRGVLGQLVRRLRAEYCLPLSHGAVLGRLEREGAQSVSDLAHAEHVRPQSMAQTVSDLEAEALLERHPDPDDRRRALIQLTERGQAMLKSERGRREGWLAQAITTDLSPEEQAVLSHAVELLRRLAET